MKSFINVLLVLLSICLFSTLSLCDDPDNGPEDTLAPAPGTIMQCAIKYQLSWSNDHVFLISYKWMQAPNYNVAGEDMVAVVNSFYSPRNKEITITPEQSGLEFDVIIHSQRDGLPYGWLKYGSIDLNFANPAHCDWSDEAHIMYCPFEC